MSTECILGEIQASIVLRMMVPEIPMEDLYSNLYSVHEILQDMVVQHLGDQPMLMMVQLIIFLLWGILAISPDIPMDIQYQYHLRVTHKETVAQ